MKGNGDLHHEKITESALGLVVLFAIGVTGVAALVVWFYALW